MTLLRTLVEGELCNDIAVTDRGLHYGDGLFETIAVIAGRPRRWLAHLQRLQWGLQRLGFPDIDVQCLTDESVQLCDGVERGVLKMLVTRGSGGRGYRSPAHATPTRILQLYAWPDYPSHWQQRGVQVRVCTTRLAVQPALAGMKHLNRLEQILARREWDDPAIAEGLMFDTQERVISGTMSNVFFVSQGELHTPDVTQSGIRGITRAAVLDIAERSRIPSKIGTYRMQDLLHAQEIFLCNSVIGVWPVASLEGYALSPGAVTRVISAALDA